jgi:hypothetical protein
MNEAQRPPKQHRSTKSLFLKKEPRMNDELNDLKEELQWWKGYAKKIEAGFREVRAIINESNGVVGYHLNGDLATWDELLNDSLFEITETEIDDVNSHITTEQREVLYIKSYPHQPCTVQYTPVYGGTKYIKQPDNQSFGSDGKKPQQVG